MKKQKTIWESPKLVFNIGETEDLFTENSPGCDCADSEDLFSIYSLGCDIAESDLISDYSPGCSNINYYRSDNMEVEECTWKGTPLSELYTNIGKFQYPPVKPSENHTVLFKLPLVKGELIKPFPSKAIDVWDKDHVRMPHSLHSLYPVTDTKLRRRWELVQQALSRPILCSQQLEKAILHYNSKYSTRWNFDGLHNFFAETLDDEETDYFFFKVLPRIIQLALSLPHLITGGIPLLRRNKTHSISLSQQQISSLLANAFLCTFPRRNTSNIQSEYNTYPNINFNRLFMPSTSSSLQEKLKCLINYFRRVCTKVPDGVVTYSRHYVPPDQTPAWNKETMYLPKLHVSSSGTIEDEGQGMLQIDFANKFVGGGVLRLGAVQEEIRFVICPELIVARLFTECLDDTEALIVVGVERFSNYRGYAKSFNWVGDCQDKTPCDSFGRRYCTVVAVDAIPFPKASLQYSHSYINRELNKAYTGFCWGASKLHMEMHSMTLDDGCKTSIATGNWGCGAFNGNVYLKALLQLMAAGKTGRDVAYFTFGDVELRDKLMEMHTFLTKKKVTVGHLSNLLCQYDATKKTDLYTYLYRAVNNEKELYTKQEDIHSTSHDRKEKEKHTPFDDLEDTWFINSEDFEAVLENVDDSKSTAKHDQQNETKCKFLDTKSYSVSSDLCVQRQNDSWISLRETKQDFSKSENVNKIESKHSPERQRKGPLKRKISDYFTPSSKS